MSFCVYEWVFEQHICFIGCLKQVAFILISNVFFDDISSEIRFCIWKSMTL